MSAENTPKAAPSRGEEILRLIQQRCQQHLGPGVEVKLILNHPEAQTEEQGQKFTFIPCEGGGVEPAKNEGRDPS